MIEWKRVRHAPSSRRMGVTLQPLLKVLLSGEMGTGTLSLRGAGGASRRTVEGKNFQYKWEKRRRKTKAKWTGGGKEGDFFFFFDFFFLTGFLGDCFLQFSAGLQHRYHKT